MKKGDNCVGYSCYMSNSEAVSTDLSHKPDMLQKGTASSFPPSLIIH